MFDWGTAFVIHVNKGLKKEASVMEIARSQNYEAGHTPMDLAFSRKSEKRPFICRQDPGHARTFLILRLDAEGGYGPVGRYKVLDKTEDPMITEKKMINLMAIVNGHKDEATALGNLTGQRLLFNVVSETTDAESKTKIIFRTHDGSGVSRENAILTLEKGVFHDDRV